jgi:hypothetical protein
VAPAVVSAAVALVIASITEWRVSKRATRDLLTRKLEDVYVLVNQASEDNLERSRIVHEYVATKGQRSGDQISEELYHYGLNKKISMFIKLYFPLLNQSQHRLFEAQRRLNQLIYRVIFHGTVPLAEFELLAARVAVTLRDLEQEMIDNRDILIGTRSPRGYTRVTSSLPEVLGDVKPTGPSGEA